MPGKQAKVVTPPMLKRMLRRVSRSSFPARDRARLVAPRSTLPHQKWCRSEASACGTLWGAPRAALPQQPI